MEVEPETALMCLGDLNGRLSKIETNIKTDANGRMVEDWITKKDLHHLNQTDQCTGKYTFISKNGKSSIDHILVNEWLMDRYIAIHIDEDRVQLDISDHCAVRAWFRMGARGECKKNTWRKPKYKDIQWIKKDETSLENFEKTFAAKIGKCTKFRSCMNKIKDSTGKKGY